MTGLRLTPAAQGDFDAIWAYTVDVWGISQAERYLLAIRDRPVAITDGRSTVTSAQDVRPGYSEALVGMHVIYMRAGVPDGIEVVRILHQSMDAGRRLPRSS